MSEPSPQYLRSGELLSRGNSRLLIIDVQEKLLPLIPVEEKLIGNCRRLIVGADVLGVPTFGTEQYPKGLGPTTPILAELLDHLLEKRRFSSAEVLNWGMAAEQDDDRDQIVVAGLEAHVCVQQTSLDLLAQGYRVFIPADAVASRYKLDWQVALGRLSDSGAIITTTESVLFEWCEVAGTPEFRQISKLIKGQ
jgi:nicotinamidase-related amidase